MRGANYWLETPYEKGRITVEDAPFTAVDVEIISSGKEQNLLFRTNLDHAVVAGPDHAIRVETHPETGAPAPYIHVRDGLEARILRPVFYELAKIAVEEDGQKGHYGVWSQNVFYPIGTIQSNT